MYTKFLTASGKLNTNAIRKVTLSELIMLKELSNTADVSINTALYCIHNSVACRKCNTCGGELEIENFVVGWKESKRFCSVKCKSDFNPTKSDLGEVLIDYDKILDVNGNPSSGKMSKYINLNTIKDLQDKTGLKTIDVNTLLYAVMNIEFTARNCGTCNNVMSIHNFKIGYREGQQFCSYKCKDENDKYKNKLSTAKTGITRYSSNNFVNDVLLPWYEERIRILHDDYDITTKTTLDEYIVDKKVIEFSCGICNHDFVSNFSNNGRIPRCPICKSRSKQQVEISKFVTSLGFDIIFNNRTVISPNEIDVYIPFNKVGIEYDGFYWHNNKDDSAKYAAAESNGIRMVRVFEDEYKYKTPIVLSRIRSILGKIENKIYARNCVLKELDSHASREFLVENHIQGHVSSAINYGLYYKDELVSVMTIGKPRYTDKFDYELLRFASKINTTVVGAASKLFSHFKKSYSGNIISYCDLRYGTGNVYEKLGFTYSHTTAPNYFYYKNGTRHSRVKFQKHKLAGILENFDENLSESVNMGNNGYLKIFDCGNKVYTMNV